MWHYNGKVFTSEMIEDHIGFVYVITHLPTKKKYVGKKLFVSKRKLPPLKGKNRKRTVIKESDWQTYYGSSEEVKALVEEVGDKGFKREILHLCKTRGVMSYLEAKQQFDRNVLLSEDYFNGIIQVKIHRSHVKSLIKDE